LTGPLTLTCPFTVFPPGATATVSLTTLFKLRADQPLSGVYPVYAFWTIKSHGSGSTNAGTRDPDPTNDARSEVVNICGSRATDPKCPPAQG
jgi:hypothetical protein